MASIYDFLPPGARQQAGYAGILNTAGKILEASAPSLQPGGAVRALGVGLGGFNQGYQGSINSALQQGVTARQMAELERKEKQHKAQQAAIEGMFEPAPAQYAMAGNERPGPTMAAASRGAPAVAQIFPGANPDMLRTFAQANPDGFMTALQSRLMPTPRAPVAVGRDQRLVDPMTGREVVGMGPEKTPDWMNPDYRDFRKELAREGRSSVNVDNRNMGPIPPGYERFTTPEGGVQMRPIPGSPAAAKAADKNRADQERGAEKHRQADVVLTDIDRAMKLVTDSSLPTTGLGGSWLSGVPGTGAHDLSRLLETVKANVGFDKLQAMRNASQTGGALGQVSEFENRLLQSVLGSLEQSQSQEQFMFNLRRLNNTYLDIIHGPGEGPERMSLAASEGGSNVAPRAAINHLKMNPKLAEDFDKKYGAGAAKKVLGK